MTFPFSNFIVRHVTMPYLQINGESLDKMLYLCMHYDRNAVRYIYSISGLSFATAYRYPRSMDITHPKAVLAMLGRCPLETRLRAKWNIAKLLCEHVSHKF